MDVEKLFECLDIVVTIKIIITYILCTCIPPKYKPICDNSSNTKTISIINTNILVKTLFYSPFLFSICKYVSNVLLINII